MSRRLIVTSVDDMTLVQLAHRWITLRRVRRLTARVVKTAVKIEGLMDSIGLPDTAVRP